jgi:hypothetical protein
MYRKQEIKDVLKSIFVSEVIQPSPILWIVSPWISDIEIIDNTSGNFDFIEPAWGHRNIYLSEVIIKFLQNGGKINIVTSNDEHNNSFIKKVMKLSDSEGEQQNIRIKKVEKLHTKGILSNCFYLHGSMNITFNGIDINDEQINLETSKESIADASLAFKSFYKGML